MSPKTRKIKHGSVRITSTMIDSIKDFIESDIAQAMALDSRSAVVKEAVRRLLEHHGHYSMTPPQAIECPRCDFINDLPCQICRNCGTPLQMIRSVEH